MRSANLLGIIANMRAEVPADRGAKYRALGVGVVAAFQMTSATASAGIALCN